MDCRPLFPWDSLGKNTGVGCHDLPQGGLPNPGIKLRSPTLQTDSFTIWATPGKLSTKYSGRSKTLSEKQNFRRVIITVNSFLGIQEHMFQQSEGVNQKKSFQEKSGSSTKTPMKAPHWNRTAGPRSNCPNGNLRGDATERQKCVNAQSCLTLCDPMYHRPPGSLSMGFSRQEYFKGQPFPSPGDLPDPGIGPRSPTLQADSLPL